MARSNGTARKINRSKKPIKKQTSSKGSKVRYAVVGLGYISQAALLPAFQHASENSELAALVSSDPAKLKAMARKYHVADTYSYEQYADCLKSGDIDAVYIGLPNHMHRAYAESAAQAGVHVLCSVFMGGSLAPRARRSAGSSRRVAHLSRRNASRYALGAAVPPLDRRPLPC